MSNQREPHRRERTHDPGATPVGARRGYVRTITTAMIILVALVIIWWIIARIAFL
jgi:hypothetical protein